MLLALLVVQLGLMLADSDPMDFCGQPNREVRIVNGVNAERNEYPWQVRLSMPDCPACFGGSILTRDKILTAAHSVRYVAATNITVWSRDHDWRKADGEQSHAVCNKTEHPEFDIAKKHDKDIAILHLCQLLMFSETVQPICLPDPTLDYDNVTAVVTGWGNINMTGPQADVLQEVNVSTMTNQECGGHHGHHRITPAMICAGAPGRDACHGDSGGPLAVLGPDGRYSQIGIVSWSKGCARDEFPGVYTRVTALLDWINTIIQKPGVRLSIAMEDQIGDMRDQLSLLIRRVNNLDEENKELQEKIEDVRNPPFGYFCSYQDSFSAATSVITYDKLLYSNQFGLQGDSPGIDINTGKFVSGFSGTWRVDFSLYTDPDPGERIIIYLYKNGEQIPETLFVSHPSSAGSGYDYNTGGRSLLLHLDLGDELHLATTRMEDYATRIIFCVSMEKADA